MPKNRTNPTTAQPLECKQPSSEGTEEGLSPREFRGYLEGIELVGISLKSLSAQVNDELRGERVGGVNFKDSQEYAQFEGGFKIRYTGTLSVRAKRKVFVKIQTVYELDFTSRADLPDGFFQIYMQESLPLQVWPFVRQTFYDITARMNLPTLTLPLRKTSGIGSR